MIRRPPRSTRTDTLFPYTTLFRSLRQMGKELAASFAQGMRADDKLYVCDPVYFGGTVDRSIGREALVAAIDAGGANAVHMTPRANCGADMLEPAQNGARIMTLGAGEATPHEFGLEPMATLLKI